MLFYAKGGSVVKKALVCLMLVFVTLFTFGCANVSYSLKFADGAIVQELAVDIKTDGMTAPEIKSIQSKVIDVMIAYNLNMETYWRERRAEWEGSDSKVLKKHQLLYAMYTGDSELFIENGQIKISKAFASIYAYLFYNYPDLFEYDAEEDAIKLKKSFLADVPLDSTLSQTDEIFLTKYIQECMPLNYNGESPVFEFDVYKAGHTYYAGEKEKQSPYYTYDEHAVGNKLRTSIDLSIAPQSAALIIAKGTTLQDAIKACFTNGADYDFEDANVKYQYKTPYRRLHSNATKIEKSDRYYVHTWDLTSFDDIITISRTYANEVVWYVVAIGVTVVFIVVATIVALIFRKKDKSKNEEIIIDDKKDTPKKDDKKDDNKDDKKDDEKGEKKNKKDDKDKEEKNKNWIDRIYD